MTAQEQPESLFEPTMRRLVREHIPAPPGSPRRRLARGTGTLDEQREEDDPALRLLQQVPPVLLPFELPDDRPQPRVRRARVALAVAALLVLVAVAAIVWNAMGSDPPPPATPPDPVVLPAIVVELDDPSCVSPTPAR